MGVMSLLARFLLRYILIPYSFHSTNRWWRESWILLKPFNMETPLTHKYLEHIECSIHQTCTNTHNTQRTTRHSACSNVGANDEHRNPWLNMHTLTPKTNLFRRKSFPQSTNSYANDKIEMTKTLRQFRVEDIWWFFSRKIYWKWVQNSWCCM